MLTSENVREVIAETVIGLDVSEMNDDSVFNESGIDSLDHANVLLGLEEKFGVSFPEEEDTMRWSTINQILEYCNEDK